MANPTPAAAATACVILLADADAAAANPFYWHRARPAWEAVTDALARAPGPEIPGAAEALRLEPASVERYECLRSAVAAHLAADQGKSAKVIREALVRVHAGARVGYHLGARRGGRSPVAGRPKLSARRRGGPDAPQVNVVIPFRDDEPRHGRLENLTACLAALADQSLDPRRYAVTVVESDATDRRRDRIAPLADEYLFVRHEGPFNKSWTVNVGAVRTRFPAPLVCVLDADALPDRDYLARNVARFDAPGVGSVVPLRSVLYLDAESSAWAVERRCVQKAGSVPTEQTRGFLVYRSPGICVWTRREVFEAVHGLDERYEGWGGEDMDLLLRLTARSALHQFDDVQLHLHHRVRDGILDANGNTPNTGLPFLTWEPEGPIGDPDKYTAPRAWSARRG